MRKSLGMRTFTGLFTKVVECTVCQKCVPHPVLDMALAGRAVPV
jgi:hypothetical protein